MLFDNSKINNENDPKFVTNDKSPLITLSNIFDSSNLKSSEQFYFDENDPFNYIDDNEQDNEDQDLDEIDSNDEDYYANDYPDESDGNSYDDDDDYDDDETDQINYN